MKRIKYKLLNLKNKKFKFFYPYISEKELRNFYKKKYFSVNKNYNYKYQVFEKNYFKNFAQIIFLFIEKNINKKIKKLKLIDIGCGNGTFIHAASSYFKEVVGADFSKKNLKYKLKKNCKFIEYKENPLDLLKKYNNYDIFTFNNVIEHLVNPSKFLNNFKKKLNRKQYILINVPNDFSNLQKKISKKNKYWVSFPEHQNYFNKLNFISFIKKYFRVIDIIGDFPIEMLQLVNDFNYIKYPVIGKKAHEFRCKFLNYIAKENLEYALDFLKICNKLNISRNNIFLLKKK